MSREIVLSPVPVTAEEFAPYGQLIAPREDGTPFGPEDAQLDLCRGIPRLYMMRLQPRVLTFDRITRHARVTQCLAAMNGRNWLIAVAPPIEDETRSLTPHIESIRAFQIAGGLAIKLHRGTWHAGPFFTGPAIDFLNLELSDTNEVDHINCHLARDFDVTFRFEA